MAQEDQSSSSPSGPLVSVVVPIYNVSGYLSECLDSLQAQTLTDFEVVCVDDGSTDDSAQIAAGYADLDRRLTLLRQENGGLSAARNTGLRHARGEYVLFLDSDDYLSAQTLYELTQTARRDDLDVLFFDGESFFESVDLSGRHSGYESYYSRKGDYRIPVDGPTLFAQMLEADDYRPSACLQLIRRQHLAENRLDFYEGIVHEDNLFTFQSLLSARRAAHTPQPFYMRRVRSGSITTQPQPDRELTSALVTYVEMNRFLAAGDWPVRARPAIADYVNRALSRAVRHSVQLTDDQIRTIDGLDAGLERQIALEAVLMHRREVLRRRIAESSTRARIRRKLGGVFR
jgi:glycosyltransferase involved in cell wall biosynthesis